MLHVTLILCDTLLTASVHRPSNLWIGHCVDALTGKREDFQWNTEQMAAVIALAMAGDDLPVEEVQIGLRKIASPLVADWASEVNPIP